MRRRNAWVPVFGALAGPSVVLAACGSQASAPSGQTDATGAARTGQSAASGKKLEIFSWWTNGGEATGLEAMYAVYKKTNPGVEIVNATVAGGAGTNAKTVLKTRLQGGQPPDSWQVHAGKELVSYVDVGQMEPLTQFFSSEGLDKIMPKLLLEQITYKNEIWSVPVNIHRANMLWFNKKLFADNNLTPPATLDEFASVADALKAKGVTPLAVGGKDKFETPHLFETVLLATFGPDDYGKLVRDPNMWSDARVGTAAETLKKLLGYANADRSALGWADAAQLVIDGKAGMTVMGDWSHGYFLSKGKKPNVDYGYAPAPGTDGIFTWLSDSFGLAKNAPSRENALAWLRVCGSRDGQDAFNPKKGSIPARTDGNKELYDEYLKSAMAQFASNKLAPSIVHGAAAPEAYMDSYGNALNVFSSDTDVKNLLQSLKDAARDLK